MNEFTEGLCIPILDIFTAPGRPVEKVLILTRYTTTGSNKDVEVGMRIPVPWEPRPYVFTPTSEAVLRCFTSLILKGRVLWLNDDSPEVDTSVERAVMFAQSQGFHPVIIPHGVPIPESLAKLTALLRKAQATGLALYWPSRPQLGERVAQSA